MTFSVWEYVLNSLCVSVIYHSKKWKKFPLSQQTGESGRMFKIPPSLMTTSAESCLHPGEGNQSWSTLEKRGGKPATSRGQVHSLSILEKTYLYLIIIISVLYTVVYSQYWYQKNLVYLKNYLQLWVKLSLWMGSKY